MQLLELAILFGTPAVAAVACAFANKAMSPQSVVGEAGGAGLNKDVEAQSGGYQPLLDGQVDHAALSPHEVIAIEAIEEGPISAAFKRSFDIIAALSIVIVTLPVLVLVAIAIPLDSRGSIIYRQKRVGLNGELFDILKFRSMTSDAESDGAQWASENDPRITRVGRIIRATRLDEIPQAFNVLKGEMSFVGPRPERPEFVELLEREIPNYQLRHVVKPGITGWAQVKYVYGASVEDAAEKLNFDLYYIKNFSMLRDLMIVAMTVRVALFGIGSR